MNEAARLRAHIDRLTAEIAEHKTAIRRHRRRIETAGVALGQARAALAVLSAPLGEEGEGVLHGQPVCAQP